MASKQEQSRPRIEIAETRPEASEAIVLETLDNIDRQADETMNRLSDLESLPLNSDDVLLAVEVDAEVGLSANAQKFKNSLEQANTILRAEIFEALAPDKTAPWDPAEEMKALKLKLREIRKDVKGGKLSVEDGRNKELWLVEFFKLEYMRQQEAMRELQETLINAANDSLITASGLTLRELDEACKNQEKANELMKKNGTNNLVDLFAIREDKVDYDELVRILEKGASKARLTPKQTGLFRQGLDTMFARHDKASELIRKLGHGKELAAAILGMKPKDVGEVEVLQGFGTLYFRFHHEESYARFAASKFNPEEKITDEEKSFAAHSGGISIGQVPKGLEELTGGLIAEKAIEAPYEPLRHKLKLHETQHALRRVYPPLDLPKSRLILQAIDENIKDKPNLDVIAGGIESGARNQRISEIDPQAHDEILAYFVEGSSVAEIYEILTTSLLYDYYGRNREDYQSTGSTLTSLDENLRKKIIDRVFRDEYYGEIYRALRVIERMQELGMKNQEIRTALLTVPLVRWPTFLRRLMEQRFSESRKLPDFNSLNSELAGLYIKIEQDLTDLALKSEKPAALEANWQSARKVEEALNILKQGNIEKCLELLEEAIGEKGGGQSGVLGWAGVRGMVRELYNILDGRSGLPAYGFETEDMPTEQIIEIIMNLTVNVMRQDQWWRFEKEISLGNYDEIRDELREVTEVTLADAIKAKKAGQGNDQLLRRLRSALRAL